MKADESIAASTVTIVPADYFDRLVARLDETDRAPRLASAARRARQLPRRPVKSTGLTPPRA